MYEMGVNQDFMKVSVTIRNVDQEDQTNVYYSRAHNPAPATASMKTWVRYQSDSVGVYHDAVHPQHPNIAAVVTADGLDMTKRIAFVTNNRLARVNYHTAPPLPDAMWTNTDCEYFVSDLLKVSTSLDVTSRCSRRRRDLDCKGRERYQSFKQLPVHHVLSVDHAGRRDLHFRVRLRVQVRDNTSADGHCDVRFDVLHRSGVFTQRNRDGERTHPFAGGRAAAVPDVFPLWYNSSGRSVRCVERALV